MSELTYTQIMHNKKLFELAKAKAALAAAPQKKPKWAFNVLAVAGGKVEAFDDYTIAQRWTASYGGGVVYPRDLIADYTPVSVTLKDGMKLHEAEIEPMQLELTL